MSDFQVSVDGQTYALPEPFIVLATQNPIEHTGTYELPEAQLDRFLMKIEIGYPSLAAELEILSSQRQGHPIDALEPVITGEQIKGLQEAVCAINVEQSLAAYILELANLTRRHKALRLGVSTRGALMLYRACQARALIEEREFVTPDDIKALARPVWRHRIAETSAAGGAGRDGDVITEILNEVPVPV